VCSPQVGNNLWKTPCPADEAGRKSCVVGGSSRVSSEGGSPMEGTSGVADPDPLRGESGEAALGPGSCRDCASGPARPMPGGARALRASGARDVTSGLSTPRERVAQGHTSPTLFAFTRESRERAVGSSETSRPASAGQRRVASESPADAPAVPRREVSEWIGLGRSSVIGSRVYVRSTRHPGGATWREAPGGFAARSLTRETSAGARWTSPSTIRKDRGEIEPMALPGFSGRCGGWGLNPIREVSFQSSASWACCADDV